MNNPVNLIKQLDYKSNSERRRIIVNCLREYGVDYRTQDYATGVNLVVDLGTSGKRIGISSHFDRVPEAPGANGNGSAVAVCLDIIRSFQQKGNRGMGLRIFFFDEEETGLKGSSAYIEHYGVEDMIGVINMELVGIGDKFAIWPVDEYSRGNLLDTFERCSKDKGTVTKRFDRIITNTADHLPFRTAGLAEAFTITCISDRDIETANQYYEAMEKGTNTEALLKILSQAPIFVNYHKPGDAYNIINEGSVLMTSSIIWDTVVAMGEALKIK